MALGSAAVVLICSVELAGVYGHVRYIAGPAGRQWPQSGEHVHRRTDGWTVTHRKDHWPAFTDSMLVDWWEDGHRLSDPFYTLSTLFHLAQTWFLFNVNAIWRIKGAMGCVLQTCGLSRAVEVTILPPLRQSWFMTAVEFHVTVISIYALWTCFDSTQLANDHQVANGLVFRALLSLQPL